jgi:hypothetical protein
MAQGEGGGRPRKAFDIEQFEEMCKIQCTEAEISAVLGMNTDTLEKNVREHYDGRSFSDVFAEKREGGRSSLRRAQWKKAVDGNGDTIMQIFLGKNILGQMDKQDINHTIGGDLNIFIGGNPAGEDQPDSEE